MFYVTWDFPVKSSHASPAPEPFMLLVNPWRLTLLVIIPGCATRFMMDKMKTRALLRSRSMRLMVPLVFCVFVIVPPQTYFEIVEKLGFTGSFGEFYGKYATASGGWGIITPTYNHLWFVAYLFIYTLLIVGIGPLLKRMPRQLAGLATGLAIILIPFLFLFATPRFPGADVRGDACAGRRLVWPCREFLGVPVRLCDRQARSLLRILPAHRLADAGHRARGLGEAGNGSLWRLRNDRAAGRRRANRMTGPSRRKDASLPKSSRTQRCRSEGRGV
jgi:hypothetical protein